MRCRICKGSLDEVYHGVGSRTLSIIPIYYCGRCIAYFTYPDSVDYSLSSTTIIDYYKRYQTAIKTRHNIIFNFLRSRYLLNKGRFLDIGSGIGFSLGVAEELEWYALGVEPSVTLAQYTKNMNKNVIEGFFSEQLIFENEDLAFGNFDYILIDNVLEHVDDPIGFMQLAQGLLAKNGILIVAVPQVDWLRLLLIKFRYIRNSINSSRVNLFYDLEQHLNYFSRTSIKSLINNLGVDSKLILLEDRFHHSKILNGKISKFLNFETGYYFIKKIY